MVNKNVGDTVYIDVRVRNTGNISYTFKIGVSIGYGSTWYDVEYYNDGQGEYVEATLSPNTETTIQRTLQIPDDVNISDVWVAVKDQSLVILNETVESGILTVSSVPSQEQFVYPTDDTYVRSDYPTDTNADTTSITSSLDTTTNIRRNVYLRFAVPDVNIEQVFLRMYVEFVGIGWTGSLNFRDSETRNWSEDTATWINKPSAVYTWNDVVSFGSAVGFWTNIDITNLAKANKGQYMTIAIEGWTDHVYVRFSSKEGSNKPNLRVIYTP